MNEITIIGKQKKIYHLGALTKYKRINPSENLLYMRENYYLDDKKQVDNGKS